MTGTQKKMGPRRKAPSGTARLRKEIDGFAMRASTNPSAFVQLPWNNWAFERTYDTSQAGVAKMKIGDIIDQIVVRLGIASSDTVRLKVQSARGWVTAEGFTMPDLNVEFYELAGQQIGGQTQFPRKTMRDKGTLNLPAHCGYVYPKADQKEIFGNAERELSIARFQSPVTAASTLTIRIQVIWQTGADLSWYRELISFKQPEEETDPPAIEA